MKKKSLALLIGVALILVAAGVVFAFPGNKFGKAVTPPFPQPAEKDLQKIVFIRYAPGFQKEKPCNDNGVCDPDEKGWCSDCKGGEEPAPTPKGTACYDFLANSKPRWNWVEDYYYSDSTLESPSFDAVTTWDAATSGDIFGSGESGAYPWRVYDYTNAISFGDYPEEGVIAVTAIWFRGKNIYEYDIMFDTDFFPEEGVWAYDLPTVTLHEFGHGAGLNDLDDAICVSEVMYGIYDGVDLDLGPGDTASIQRLYGL